MLALQHELLSGLYRHGAYTDFKIFDPKQRLISAAPYRDRVVHHALCNVIEPLFDRTFIDDSHACRKGKGTHAAVARFSEFAKKNRYVLKCDIQKYFQSIDQKILLKILARKIRCRRTMALIEKIVGSRQDNRYAEYFPGDDLFAPFQRNRAIPIGNLTSQFFANVYLNGFDHFVKEGLACRCYIRYVDDFVLFGNDKEWLHEVKCRMEEYLAGLRLKMHRQKSRVYRTQDGVAFLGYRIFPSHRLLKKDNVLRMRRRLKAMQADYAEGNIDLAKVRQRIHSWLGHAGHADTFRLRERLLSGAVFTRGAEPKTRSGRLLEQRS